MGTATALALGDLLLSAGINYLLQKQKVDAVIATARAEGREVTPEELDALKVERDKLADEVNGLLDSVS